MIEINGHRLPDLLEQLIAADRWDSLPTNPDFQSLFFPDRVDADYGKFYPPALMQKESDPDDPFWLYGHTHRWFGESSRTVDRSKLVVIAEICEDSPLALHYGEGLSGPEVLFLRQRGWQQVAPDFETFVQSTGLLDEESDDDEESDEQD